ncbi:MAG: 5'/3'-nucleotidase SurE [Sulfuricurvum sp.]|nr:5'/3'-nucleotidase SurE [Sulfuricurvum sp.]
MKKILITNDDGYESQGLLALIDALKDLAHITVVAPSTEKSACGHSLTLTRPLSFIGVTDDFYKLDDGTPSDCVYLALHSMFEDAKPDLVISGINKGSNMGEDITYSGTAAGAMEGVLQGVPSIAISQVMDFEQPMGDFTLAKKAIRAVVEKIFAGTFPLKEREFININVPYDVNELRFAVTYAGYRHYGNDAHLHRNPRGMEYYWLGLHPLDFKPRIGREGLCDFEAIVEGMVSLTPVKLDMSAYKSIKQLQEWL